MELTKDGKFHCKFIACVPLNEPLFEELQFQFTNHGSEYWTKKKCLQEINVSSSENNLNTHESLHQEQQELSEWISEFDDAYKRMNLILSCQNQSNMFKSIIEGVEKEEEKDGPASKYANTMYLFVLFFSFLIGKSFDSWTVITLGVFALIVYNLYYFKKLNTDAFTNGLLFQLLVSSFGILLGNLIKLLFF